MFRKKEYKREQIEVKRPPLNSGLSKEEVDTRKKAGLSNVVKKPYRGFFQILANNLFTFFNVILIMIAAAFLITSTLLNSFGYHEAVEEYFGISKYFFLIAIILNTIIGTIQEYHSTRVISKLEIVTESGCQGMRDGKIVTLKSHEIVRDDVLYVTSGEQALVDMVIEEGDLEVDESLLTGESEPVKKHKGDSILAGSIVMVGAAKCYAVKVGAETYSSKLTAKVRSLSNHKSQLMADITKIIRRLSILLVLVVLITLITMIVKVAVHGGDPAYWDVESIEECPTLSSPSTWAHIIVTCGSFAVGVIPTGLVLLTSITLAESVIKLARKKTMIQGLYSLENLSRVDILCLDKTGTLTDGSMKVVGLKSYAPVKEVKEKIRDLLGSSLPLNMTSEALLAEYGKNEGVEILSTVPFSSKRKCSGIVYPNGDKLYLGAPEFLLHEDNENLAYAQARAKEGKRVLALTLNDELWAYFVLSDNLRPSSNEILSFFYRNNVDIKIISGDNPLTVSKIAEQAGVYNADRVISLEGVELEKIPELVERYTVFARVSPEQKQAIVEALQQKGHKVGMTGDGVNDILALRKADAAISFQKASDAAKSCADVILLDNDFARLTDVVAEGRRVIHNVERSSSMFIMKSLFVFLLCFILIFIEKGQFWYSLETLYMLELVVLGFGGVLLSLENNTATIEGNFLAKVTMKALVSAFLILFAALVPILVFLFSGGALSENGCKALMCMLVTLSGLVVTFYNCRPFNKYRTISFLTILCAVIFLGMLMPPIALGGERMNISTFFVSPTGNPWDARFLHEMFQPWNSPVVSEAFSNWISYVIVGGFLFVAVPLYFFARIRVDKIAAKMKPENVFLFTPLPWENMAKKPAKKGTRKPKTTPKKKK